jgi:acyl-CoA synthetase (NDP forming)
VDDAHPHALTRLFTPRSVAVIGASEQSPWTVLVHQCMRAYGFQGRTYGVNRSGAAVFGWPGFTSCRAIGAAVDAAYLCVPKAGVAEALEDMAQAGIAAAVVLTSGYSETGPAGARAQEALAARAAALGVRMLGPNCLGFANIRARTAITAVLPRGELLPNGRIGFVCQSGATAAEILEFSQLQGVAVGFYAATGNEAQITLGDVVDYLVADPDTRVIMVVAETIRHPERFARAARRALMAAKPLIVLKAGKSELAARVAQAHTGALVGDDRVFTAVCHKLGMIRVSSLEDLVITAGLLADCGPLRRGGAGIASISGGACSLISDHSEAAGLPLPAFAPATVAELREVLPDFATSLNPLDVTGAAVRDPSLLEKVLSIIAQDPGVAIRVCVLNLPIVESTTTPTAEMLAAAGRGLSSGNTPGVLAVQTLKPLTDYGRRLMKQHGISALTGGLDHGVRALALAIRWSSLLRAVQTQATAPESPRARERAPIALLERTSSSERDVLAYLGRFGVPVIPAEITRSAEQAAHCARRFGGRVVLKVASPDITHKTDVGGVRLGLEGDAEVIQAWGEIDASVRKAVPEARIDGVLVSPMREQGIELFVGTARDPDWGMVIAVGLGGTWVEVLRDTAVRVLPVEREDVLEMLASLHAARVLQGFRGSAAADPGAIADVVVNIGTAALALDAAAVALEVNPLLADGACVEALDGLVVWS